MQKDGNAKGQLRTYLLWPLILSVPVLAANLAAAAISRRAALIVLPFTLLYLAAALWLFFSRRKRLLGALVQYSSEYAQLQRQLITQMQVPYALADTDGRILWRNRAFAVALGEEKVCKSTITAIFPGITKQELAVGDKPSETHVTLNDECFLVRLQRVSLHDCDENGETLMEDPQDFLAVYLFNETEAVKNREEIAQERPVVGLIYLDNYEETMESVEEVRRSLLIALIDRRINKYISSLEGIVKKLEKDKYLFVVNRKNADQMLDERFPLLEEVKGMSIGNEMEVTLSIGLGMDGGNYSNNYDFARAAIDLALGRGGDQAVVKAGSKTTYYGGKSQQQEKATRVKARVKAHALEELLETRDRVLIMGHSLGDIDSFGASVGMFRIAASQGRKAHIVINELTTSVQPMLERFQNNPDYPDDMIVTGSQAEELMDANTVLIVVDVSRPTLTDAPQLLRQAKTIVVFDHHRQGSEGIANAVLSYVEPYASSTCEMIAEVMQYIEDGVKIRPAEADAMYAGIVIDTNNFQVQAGVRTFEAAAYLRRCGADVTRVRKMFRDSIQENKARAEAVASAEIYSECFAISELLPDGLASPTVVCAQAANELLNVKGIRASVVMTLYHNVIYLSARSIDDVNVQVMMEMLGGGGHRTMAGAQLTGMTVADARGRVHEVIDEMLKRGEI